MHGCNNHHRTTLLSSANESDYVLSGEQERGRCEERKTETLSPLRKSIYHQDVLALRIQVITVSEVKPCRGFTKRLNIILSIFVNHLSILKKKEPVRLFCFLGLNDVGVSERRYHAPQISACVYGSSAVFTVSRDMLIN